MISKYLRWIQPFIIAGLNTFYGYSQLILNEFSASNNTIITDEHGDYDDWIEIFNSSDLSVDIGGMYITDSLGDPARYRIPATNPGITTIPAKSYLLLWADSQVDQGNLHLGFKLAKRGGQIGLTGYDGVSFIDTVTYTKQYLNSSSSRYPNGNGSWIYPPPTPGSANILPLISGLYINEFCTSNTNIITDEFGNYDDWIEIYNANDNPVNIGGLFFTDSLPNHIKYRISTSYPDITTIPARGYILLWADNQEEQGVLHIDFKFGRDGEQIGLTGYDGVTFIDSLTYTKQYPNSSLSRYPDGNSQWIIPPPTPGSSNTLPVITGLYLNEFSTSNTSILTDNQGEYEDWIEIQNSTNKPVDIGGLYLTDSLGVPAKHRIPTTYPDSTTIPAGGYLLLWADNQKDQGVLHTSFKLGKEGEQIGLVGYDGVTFIDSISFDEQFTNSSLSRYPEGNNQWINLPPSPGSANVLPLVTGVYINEFCTSNTSIVTDNQGEFDDWIEIYNSSDLPVDIGGLYLTDSLGNPDKCRIPTTYPDSTILPAKGYILLWLDNQEEQGILHLGFKLGKDGEQIGLTGYNGVTFIDSLTFGEQYMNSSMSRYPDGNGKWEYAPSSPGSKNRQFQTEGIFINEFMPNNNDFIADEHGEYDDWIELYNSTNEALDLGGMYITDSLEDPCKYRIPTTFPDSTTISAMGYILLWADKQEEQGILHLNFKLSKAGESVGLAVCQPDNNTFIDSISFRMTISNNQSYGRIPNGINNWSMLNSPTPGESNILTDIRDNYSAKNQLFQNFPNPFSRNTEINYYLSENFQNAMIKIYDIMGLHVKNIPLLNAGYGHIIIDDSQLKPGVYIYALIVDGLVVERKRMILTE